MVNIIKRIGNLTGIFAISLVVVPWILFLICYIINPRWILTKDALSSFGDPSFTSYPWVYNYGLGIIALIIWFMALGMVIVAENKVQVFGGASWFMAGIFLALIGYYHGGTYPHDFVSTWFFVQAAISLAIMGLGAYPQRDFIGSVVPIAIAILMPLGSIVVHWPSAATIEIYEIIIMDAVVIFTIVHSRGLAGKNRSPVRQESSWARGKGMAIVVGALATVFFALGVIVVIFAFP